MTPRAAREAKFDQFRPRGVGDVVCRKKAPNIEKVVARTATEGEAGMRWMVEEGFEASA